MSDKQNIQHVQAWADKHGFDHKVHSLVGVIVGCEDTAVVSVRNFEGKIIVSRHAERIEKVCELDSLSDLDALLDEQFGIEPEPEDLIAELLEGSIGDLAKALSTGEWDEQLDALFDAEKAGKDRKGAKEALADRAVVVGSDLVAEE